ncbi:MAG: diguanylate cyclase [Hungatella sp.]|nr:diguanylate cyclase [Hungatella sp.]
MNETAYVLFEYLRALLYHPEKAKLDIDSLPEDFRQLGAGLIYCAKLLNETRAFSFDLAKGNLNVKPPSPENELAAPLKALQGALKHITWQSQQVAKGDYHQRVDFMGEFADAFNIMIKQLDYRQKALEEELEKGRLKTLALEQNVNLFQMVTDKISQWIFVIEQESGECLSVNQGAQKALENCALDEKLQSWLSREVKLQNKKYEQNRSLEISVSEDHMLYFDVSVYPIVWHSKESWVFVLQDISKEKRQILQLESQAYYDPLTKMYSRYFGMDYLKKLVEKMQEFCLVFVDLDNLKYVNDTYGHLEGDEYIINVSNLLYEHFKEGIVCRLGGDEFMLMAYRDEETVTRVLMMINSEMVMRETGYHRSISYGVLEVKKDNKFTSSELLNIVDERMYQFKKANKAKRMLRLQKQQDSV